MGPKERKIFSQRSQERSKELSAMRCQQSAASYRDSMDEESQKCKVAYCSDRYTDNRDKQICGQKGKVLRQHKEWIKRLKTMMNGGKKRKEWSVSKLFSFASQHIILYYCGVQFPLHTHCQRFFPLFLYVCLFLVCVCVSLWVCVCVWWCVYVGV